MSAATRVQVTRIGVFVVTAAIALPVSLAALHWIADPEPRVYVRWSAQIGEADRARLEETYHLADPAFQEERTWLYVILDPSSENVRALVTDAAVDDTHDIDRASFEVESAWAPFPTLALVLACATGGLVVRVLGSRVRMLVRGPIGDRVERLARRLAAVHLLPVRSRAAARTDGAGARGRVADMSVTLVSVAVFCTYYILFLNQGLGRQGPLGPFPSETVNHMRFSIPFLEGQWREQLQTNFEPLLHALQAGVASLFGLVSRSDEMMTRLGHAAATVLSLAKVAQFVLVRRIIEHAASLPISTVLFLSLAASVCTVVYLPPVTLDIYMPMGTPNVLVDPTNILLGPLALAFFYLYLRWYVDSDAWSPRRTACLAVLLFAGTLAKPAFTNVMLVVVGLVYVTRVRRFASSRVLHDLVIFAPSGALLIWQLYLIGSSTAGGGLEIDPYKVIRHFSTHPSIALFQAMAFPALVALLSLTQPRRRHASLLPLAWAFATVAYLIFAIFALDGPSWRAANLAWSYQIGLLLLYVFSIVEYGRFLGSNERANRVLAGLCAASFGLVVLSGLHQFVTVFLGGDYV